MKFCLSVSLPGQAGLEMQFRLDFRLQSSLNTFRVIRLLYHHCAFDWISTRKIDFQREFAGLFEATVSNALISSQY